MNVDEFLDAELKKLEKETGASLPTCNCYCGVEWMPYWFRVLISEKFNKSCKIHDLYYITRHINNQDADQIFLEHMYLQAEDSLYWKCVAYFMFLNVRIFQFFAKDFIPFFKD